MMKIPFLNLKTEGNDLINEGILEDFEEILMSGHYLFGKRGLTLEREISSFFYGECEAVLVGSGTDALALSLLAIGVKPGDKVVVPALSAVPSAVSVKMIGAVPVYVDIDSSMTMCMESLEIAFDKNDISAVVPVNLYGNLCDSSIIYMCQDLDIPVVEDFAQSFGSSNNDKMNVIGTSAALSFYPTKNLGCCGDSGCVVTKNKEMADSIRELRFYGQSSKSKMGRNVGMNSRTDEMQCAILLKKLARFPAQKARRLELFNKYYKSVEGNSMLNNITWQQGAVPHIFPVLCNSEKERSEIMSILKDFGVETMIHYPFHLGAEVEGHHGLGNDHFALEVSKTIFSLPFHPWLSEDEVNYILEIVEEEIR